MKLPNQLTDFMTLNTLEAGKHFHAEISTEENKDYRRGFRAGVFFAFLQMQSDIGKMDDATTEQSTS